jgi:nitrite transporter NirC
MFQRDIESTAQLAKQKYTLLQKNPLGYWMLAMLAGIFIGIAIAFVYTVGSALDAVNSPYTRLMIGACFSVGLSLVVMAGAELFTGNNMVMAIGVVQRSVSLLQTLWLWLFCWLGNFFGSVLFSLLFHWSGLNQDAVASFIAKTCQTKMTLPLGMLFCRSVLCNFLVCLAVWCTIRMKSECGKLIMIFWCLFAFSTIGLEHSIANMSLFTLGMLNPSGYALSWSGYFYNILVCTFGNMVGGLVLTALPYLIISRPHSS